MANEPMWKTFGHNAVCSIRRCHRRPSKRLDLAIVGTRKFGAFGKEDPWVEAVGTVHIAVCDQCYEMIHETNPDVIHRMRPTKGMIEYLTEFVMNSWSSIKHSLANDGDYMYRLVSDVASRECEQPGKCGKTKPYCLSCRARHAIDTRHEPDQEKI